MAMVISLMAVVVCAGWFLIWREKRIAAAAGMGPPSPVCARCFYHLGGWPTPVCPECGSDVRAVGVRTGPRQSGAMLAILLSLSIVLILIPALHIATWLFTVQRANVSSSYHSAVVPTLVMHVESRGTWHRFLPFGHHETIIVLTQHESVRMLTHSNPPVRMGVMGGSALAKHEVRFTDRTGAPSESQIAAALQNVLESSEDDNEFRVHVQSIRSLIETMETARRSCRLSAGVLHDWTDPVFAFSGSGGGSGVTTIAWQGLVFFALLTIVTLVWCVRCVRIRYGAGSSWRSPRDKEWAESKRDSVGAGRGM